MSASPDVADIVSLLKRFAAVHAEHCPACAELTAREYQRGEFVYFQPGGSHWYLAVVLNGGTSPTVRCVEFDHGLERTWPSIVRPAPWHEVERTAGALHTFAFREWVLGHRDIPPIRPSSPYTWRGDLTWTWPAGSDEGDANDGWGMCRTGYRRGSRCVLGGIGCDVDHLAVHRRNEWGLAADG